MKKLILLLMIATSMSAQYKRAEDGKTNYKSGFVYFDNRGVKTTLIKFAYRPGESANIPYAKKEWYASFEIVGLGVKSFGWTSDPWIDVATRKAFINEQTHNIVYYDEVDITPKLIKP